MRVVFELEPRWAPMLGLNGRGYLVPNTKVEGQRQRYMMYKRNNDSLQ
jgi:hypothetical protein